MSKPKHAEPKQELQQVPMNIPYPIPDVFKYRTNIQAPQQEVMGVQQSMFILKEVKYPEEGGIYAYFEDVPYPAKGFPFPEALYAVNTVKRNAIEQLGAIVKIGSWWEALPMVGFLLIPKKAKIRFLERYMDAFARGSEKFMKSCYLKERYYSTFCKEMNKFIITLLTEYGISHECAERFAEPLVAIVDYDNAYRFRAEDIMSETTKEEMLRNPKDEIMKILAILGKREPQLANTAKFASLGKLLTVGLWVPSFRRAFLSALKHSDFQNFQYDEADRYHVLLWADYNFLGKNIQERVKMYEEFHQGKLPRRLIYTPNPA